MGTTDDWRRRTDGTNGTEGTEGGGVDWCAGWEEQRVLRIDCAECELEGSSACVDCVVTFLVGHEPGAAVVIDAAEVRALRTLARGGLAPSLRHRRRQPV